MTALQYSGIEKMELYLNHLPNRKIWAASGDYKMELRIYLNMLLACSRMGEA
jgi:hypothetical protein